MVTQRKIDIHEQKIIRISIVAPNMKIQKCKCEKNVCLESTCFLCKIFIWSIVEMSNPIQTLKLSIFGVA